MRDTAVIIATVIPIYPINVVIVSNFICNGVDTASITKFYLILPLDNYDDNYVDNNNNNYNYNDDDDDDDYDTIVKICLYQ